MIFDDTQFPTVIASRIIKVVPRWFKDVPRYGRTKRSSPSSPHSGACSYVITLKDPSVHMEPNGCERNIKKLQFCFFKRLSMFFRDKCVSIQCRPKAVRFTNSNFKLVCPIYYQNEIKNQRQVDGRPETRWKPKWEAEICVFLQRATYCFVQSRLRLSQTGSDVAVDASSKCVQMTWHNSI